MGRVTARPDVRPDRGSDRDGDSRPPKTAAVRNAKGDVERILNAALNLQSVTRKRNKPRSRMDSDAGKGYNTPAARTFVRYVEWVWRSA